MRLAGILRIVRLRIPLAIAAVVAVTGCSGSVPSHRAPASVAEPTYYLALGDSLSRGVQPDAAGTSVETRYGYPDQVYAALRPSHPALQLVKLGCPGETTSTMINGGICRYQGGSQLAAAVAFLHAHRGRVLLLTIDIGANDPEHCGSQPSLSQLASCAVTGVPGAVTNLNTVMTSLKAAAPGVRMVGMNYYLPALAEWRNGLPGQVVAWAAERLAATYNQLLDRVYTQSGARVADVFGAFETADFSRSGTSSVPRNVALLCQWTWQCAAPPRGPNQHANQVGYQVIARTFLQAAGLG
jgi:lysophospholipase L1-like esterase